MGIRFKSVAVGDRFAELAGCRTPGRVWIVERKVPGIFGKQPNKVRMWSRCEGPGVVAIDYSMSEINRLFAPAEEEHRASRMPDPVFVEAARRKFDPETPEEREAFWQKVGAVREGK